MQSAGIAYGTATSERLCLSIGPSVQVPLASGTCVRASANALMTKSLTESFQAVLPSLSFGGPGLIS